jgi:large subunit ribosomal protein L25
VQKAEASPGVKRGGTVNIVTHTIELECSVDNIPQYLEVDVSALEIGHSLHLSDITLPKGVRTLREDLTLVTIVPPSGYAEEQKAAAAAAAGAAAGTAAPAAGAAAPAASAPAAAPAAGAAAPAAGAKAPAGGGDKKK